MNDNSTGGSYPNIIQKLEAQLESVREELKLQQESNHWIAEERETFLAEHDENVRLHTQLEVAKEALGFYADFNNADDNEDIAREALAKLNLK